MTYYDEGSGPAIVLVPGGSLDSTYLKPFAQALVDGGHRVVRVETRRPPVDPDESVSMHDLADDVVEVMDELGLEQCWVAGHAFGNRVARTVALDYPDRVEGVILLAAGGAVPPSAQAQEALRIAFSDVPDAEALQAMEFMVGDPHDVPAAWQAVKQARDPSVGDMQRRALIDTPSDEWARLATGKRAVVIQGTRDQIAPPANGDQLAAEYPDQVRLVTIDDAGHLFPLLNPTATAKAILDNI
ncbi:MAG: alpha/beta fold hydrolase [Nostocoides sp.]